MSEPRAAMAAETDRFFREIVLCLGGIFASEEVDDALIWQVTKSLDRIYERARARVLEREISGDTETAPRRMEPHPAVEHLLTRIGR